MVKQKISREELTKVWEDLWAKACEVLEEFDPCQINVALKTCSAGFTVVGASNSTIKEDDEVLKRVQSYSFCCHGCKHLGFGGCAVQSLSCKLWLCPTVRNTYHDDNCFKRLTQLREIQDKYRLGMFRSPKEEAINYAYIYFNSPD